MNDDLAECKDKTSENHHKHLKFELGTKVNGLNMS